MTAYVDRARRLAGDQPALRVRPLLRFDPSPPDLAAPDLSPLEIDEEVESPSALSSVDFEAPGLKIHRRSGELNRSVQAEPILATGDERRPLPVLDAECQDNAALEPSSPPLYRDEPVAAPTPGVDRAPISEGWTAPEPGRATNRQQPATTPGRTRGRAATQPDEPLDQQTPTPAKAQAHQPERTRQEPDRAKQPDRAEHPHRAARAKVEPAQQVATQSTDRQPPSTDRQPPTTEATDAQPPAIDSPRHQPTSSRPRRAARWTVTPDSRPDEITVTIGRIEVKVVPPPTPAPTKQATNSPRPEPTRLDDYLKARASGRVG